jgi:predicted double-glycine peptidase
MTFLDEQLLEAPVARTVVRQRCDPSCGAAALATLLHHHYALPFSEAEIFYAMSKASDEPARIDLFGPSLLDLMTFLRSLGFNAQGYRLSLDQVQACATPVITLMGDEDEAHFVVLKGVQEGRVLVGDPVKDLRVFAADAFRQAWNSVALLIDPQTMRGSFNRDDEWRGALLTPRRTIALN